MAEPPAYEALRGRRGYEQYFKTLDLYKRTGSVPSRYVSNQVENLKAHIRFLGDIPGTSPTYESAREEAALARQLRNELIRTRGKVGGSVSQGLPASDPGSEYYQRPVPIEQQPIRTPFGTFSPGDTPFQQIQRKSGPVYASQQKGLARVQAENPVGLVSQDTGPDMTEIRLTSAPLAGPGISAIDMGESFVTGLNTMFEGRQVLIGKRVGDTFEVEYNPAISKSGFVDELAAERLTGYGFVEKDGKFVYSEPSFEFQYAEPEYGEVEASEFDFTVGAPVRETAPDAGKSYGFTPSERKAVEDKLLGRGKFAAEDELSGETYILGTSEELFFSPELNPQRQLYKADFAKGVGEFFAGMETKSGAYIKQSPVGEIRASQGLEFIAGTIEGAIKPFPAAGTVLGGTVASLNPFASEEQRTIARGDVYAAYPEFIKLPMAVTTVMLLSSPTKIAGKAPAAAKTKLVSTSIQDSVIAREFRRGSFSYTLNTPPGAPGYDVLKAKVAAEPLFQAGSKGGTVIGAIGRPIITGAKFGTAAAGFQAGAETLAGGPAALLSEESQKRVKGAFIGGAIVGAGFEAYKTAKPFLGKASKGAGQVVIRIKEGGAGLVQETLDLPFKGAEAATYGYFLAGSPRAAMAPLSGPVPGMERPATFKMFAEATRRGANPFTIIKPRGTEVRQRALQSDRTLTFAPSIPQRTIISPGTGQKFRFRESKREKGAFGVVTRAEIREEAITRDIQSEKGRLRVEQLEAIKQGTRPGFGLKVRTRPFEGVTDRPRQRENVFLSELPEVRFQEGILTKPRTPQRLRVETSAKLTEGVLETPFLPKAFAFSGSERPTRKGRRKKQDELSFRREYSPSVAGVSLDIQASRTKGAFGGFEIRGIGRKRGRK